MSYFHILYFSKNKIKCLYQFIEIYILVYYLVFIQVHLLTFYGRYYEL